MEFNNKEIAEFKKEVLKALKEFAAANKLIVSPKALDMNLEDESFNLTINFKKK